MICCISPIGDKKLIFHDLTSLDHIILAQTRCWVGDTSASLHVAKFGYEHCHWRLKVVNRESFTWRHLFCLTITSPDIKCWLQSRLPKKDLLLILIFGIAIYALGFAESIAMRRLECAWLELRLSRSMSLHRTLVKVSRVMLSKATFPNSSILHSAPGRSK